MSPGRYWSAWSSSCDGLGSEELFGGDVEAIGVALHSVEEPGGWVVELRSRVLAELGASSRARICCSISVGVGVRWCRVG